MILKSIYEEIINNNLQKSYELIISCENEMINSSMYWALRGDLCSKIHEYNSAIECYIKSINLNDINTYSINAIIMAYEKVGNVVKMHEYLNIKKKIEKNLSRDSISNILCNEFKNINKDEVLKIIENRSNFVYINETQMIRENEIISFEEYITKDLSETIIIPLNINYVENVRHIADKGIKNCVIACEYDTKLYFITINDNTMSYIRNKKYKNTIVMSLYNRGDSNVYALNRYIPNKYKEKYNIIVIEGTEVLDLANVVNIPLISSMTVSGHGIFLSYPYPQLTYNLEVGHGPMSFKACGNMEKTYKNFAFTPNEYKHADKMCATSTMDTILLASFVNIPENKFIISGIPRTDTLLKSNGKENLEKLIGVNIDNKKVIFNMPTFHKHENSGKIDGDSNLNSFMKVHNFNYKEFDEFLEKNQCICIMKVHHAEENLLRGKRFKTKNMYFILNEDLEKENLDLYEILNAADLLITDYSSIYSDFLFMNKPTVFTNTDINEYRLKRGLALEPYDFWTAGPKVQNQQDLQKEIIKSLEDEDYYKEKREELRTVYYKYFDDKSSERIWDFINEIMVSLSE